MSETLSLLLIATYPCLWPRHHDRNARHKRPKPLISAASGGADGGDGAVEPGGAASGSAPSGGMGAVGTGGVCSASFFAMLAENSASRARATWMPPALAKVSSGPLTEKVPSIASSVVSLPETLTSPAASAREAPRPSMPRPSMVQAFAASSNAGLASPRTTATVAPNLTRIEPRHIPSPWSGDSVAPGMHDATSAGSRSNGQTLSAGEGMVVVSVTVGMARQ